MCINIIHLRFEFYPFLTLDGKKSGKAREYKAENNFKYFMVSDIKEVTDAHKPDEFLKLVKEM